MGNVLHDEAILDGARLALIGVADHILFIVDTVANYLPFVPCRKSSASHAAQTTRLELRDDSGEVAGLNQAVEDAIFRSANVGIGMQLLAQALGTRVGQRLAVQVAYNSIG